MEIIEDEHYYLFTNAKMKINSSDYESALNDLNKINDNKVTMCIDHMKMICMFMLEKFETIIEFYYINKTKVLEYIKLNEDLLKIISCAFYECGMRKKAKELYPSLIPDFISEKSEFFLPSNKKKEELSSENVEQFSISISPSLQDKEIKNEGQNNTNTNNGQGYKECKNYFDNENQNNQNYISRTKTCQEQGNKHFKSEKIEEEKKSPSERGNKRKIPKIERKLSDKIHLSKNSGNNANIINDDKESKKSEQIPVMNNEDKQSKKSEQFPIVYNEEAKNNHREEQKEQSVKSSVSSLNKESVIKEIELKSEAGDKTNEKKEEDTQEVKEQNMSSIDNEKENTEENKNEETIKKLKEEQKEIKEEEKVKEIVQNDKDKENKEDKTEKEDDKKNQINESNKNPSSERKQDINQAENKEIINKEEVDMKEIDNILDKKSTIEKKQEEKLSEVNDIIQNKETIDNNKESKNENQVHEQQDKSNQITTEQKEASIDNEKKEAEDITTPDKIEEKKEEPINEETKNEKVNENKNTEEEVTIPKKESDYKDDQPPISNEQPPEKDKEKKEVKEEEKIEKMNDLSHEAKNEQNEHKDEQNKAVSSREDPLSKEGERLPTLTDRISFKSSENQQQENKTDNNNNTNNKEQSFSIGEISKEFVSENPPSSKTSEKKEEKIKPINLPKPGHNSIQKHPIEHTKVHATNLSPRGGTPLVDYHFNHPDYNPNKDVQQEIEKIKEIPKIEEESKKESDSEQEKNNQNDNNKIKLEPITYNLENIVRLNPKRAQTKKAKEIVIPDKAVPPAKAETERIISKKEKKKEI